MAPTYQELSADQVLVQNAVVQVQKVQVLVQVNETVLDLWCQSCAGSNCLPYDRQTFCYGYRSQKQATEKAWLFVLLLALLLVSPRQ